MRVDTKYSLDPGFPVTRLRRLRSRAPLRRSLSETRLSPEDFVAPLFVCAGEGIRRPIASLSGHSVVSVDELAKDAEALSQVGVGGVLLFGIAPEKDAIGSQAWADDGPVPEALRWLRASLPALARWADVCLCGYTSHGHCGVLADGADASAEPFVDNDRTLPLLARAAACYARAGADVVAPSDMMDGRTAALRTSLDHDSYEHVAICSYAVKYASAFYGPFREAASSSPSAGDRRGYQMDPANGDVAVREAVLDVREGADLVIVKPALAYLDVVYRVRAHVPVPVVAYNVSGEYAMVKAAAARGWIDEATAAHEQLLSIKRAGASQIVTYFAREAAERLS